VGIGGLWVKRYCAVKTGESVFMPVETHQRATVITLGGGMARIDLHGPTDEGLALFKMPHLCGSDSREMQGIKIARVEFQY
jgi:hypothetical protein